MTPTALTAIRHFVDQHFSAECDFLADIVRCPTDNPLGDCTPSALKAKELLEKLGFAVEAFEVPLAEVQARGMRSVTNLIVRHRFSAQGPCIALNAHGDVVPPGEGWTQDPYGAAIVDEPGFGPAMYGRGAAVSKSDFATYTWALLALRALHADGLALQGAVELHFTYDEEAGGELGPQWLLERGLSTPDFALCAGFSYAVTTAHNGCLHLEVTVRGRQGHAAMPEDAVDALAATNQIMTALYASREALKARRSHVHGIRHSTLNIGLIHGGINTNVVPDCVQFRLDRRVIPEESMDQAEAELRRLIESTAAHCPDIRVEIRRILKSDPLVKLPGAEKLTHALQHFGEQVLNTPITEHGVPLYTDARHYAKAGIPTVLYGAGPRTLAESGGHNADEHLRLSDLKAATIIVTAAVAELLHSP